MSDWSVSTEYSDINMEENHENDRNQLEPAIEANHNQDQVRVDTNRRRNAEVLDVDNENERQVRARVPHRLVPMNRELRNSMMMTRTFNISVNDLLSENIASIPRNTRMDLQLLRVIANSNTGNTLGPA